MKKFLAIILTAIMILSLASCGKGDPKTSVTVTVKISSDYLLLDAPVTITDTAPNALQAVIAACKANKLAYNVTDGMFDGFGGIESSQKEGWLLYLNDILSPTGAEDTSICTDDVVEFKYENYDRAFNTTTSEYIGKWRRESTADTDAAFLTLDDAEASFTYIDSERTTTSYAGRYSMANNQLIIDDIASGSSVTIPFKAEGGKLIVTYNSKTIELNRQ